ncbi:MAG: phage holin family protein [Betaproteobacteria bacterium]
MSDGAQSGTSRGLRGAVSTLGSALLGLLHTRLSLAALEFDEARDRTVASLVTVAIAVLAFAFAILGASVLVVIAYWETNRIAALCGLILAYLAIGFIAMWRLSARSRTDRPPFAETIAQFERDRAWFTGNPEHKK